MKTLAELKTANLRRASEIESITGVDNPETLAKVREYLKNFVPPGPCVKCGNPLQNDIMNAFGCGFVWGLAHGEGHCGICNYPARAYHDIPDVGKATMILQYHPNVLEEAETATAEGVWS